MPPKSPPALRSPARCRGPTRSSGPPPARRSARIRWNRPSSLPARLRVASITAICMPKQMPKYALCAAREARRVDLAFRAAPAEAARHQDAMHAEMLHGIPRSKISESIQLSLTRTLLAMPPWRRASARDFYASSSEVYLPTMAMFTGPSARADAVHHLLPLGEIGRSPRCRSGGRPRRRSLRRDRRAARHRWCRRRAPG